MYIGDEFYSRSASIMSSLYREADGGRSDWGKMWCALRDGDNVVIRPALQDEVDAYGKVLQKRETERDGVCGSIPTAPPANDETFELLFIGDEFKTRSRGVMKPHVTPEKDLVIMNRE